MGGCGPEGRKTGCDSGLTAAFVDDPLAGGAMTLPLTRGSGIPMFTGAIAAWG